MRLLVPTLLLTLTATACTGGQADGDREEAEPVGCGLVPARTFHGLLGDDVDSTVNGSLAGLREDHRRVTCRTVVRGHPERFVTISAQYHPKPMQLPAKACSEGWVYAGTPEKYTPACQEASDGRARTQLLVRWADYVMHVTIGRENRDWAGDPEQALAISRTVAERLGVREAVNAAK